MYTEKKKKIGRERQTEMLNVSNYIRLSLYDIRCPSFVFFIYLRAYGRNVYMDRQKK